MVTDYLYCYCDNWLLVIQKHLCLHSTHPRKLLCSRSRNWGDPMKAFSKSTTTGGCEEDIAKKLRAFMGQEGQRRPRETQVSSGHHGLVPLIPFIPKVGPWEGCRTHAKTFWWRWAPRACTSPIVVVLFPSPRGVGVILQDENKREITFRGIKLMWITKPDLTDPREWFLTWITRRKIWQRS